MEYPAYHVNEPHWREISVGSYLPAGLQKLGELARNFWWSWHEEARDLFAELDPKLWDETRHNPVLLLERLNYEDLEKRAADKDYLARMDKVYTDFRRYMDTKPDASRPSVAYFSMEYGIDPVLKIYSGGLGILAGDYLKEASDSNVDLCAVGLLYRYGYFDQTLSKDGQQVAGYEAQDFGCLPIEKVLNPDGSQLRIHVPYANSFVVTANVWVAHVGRVNLYLLDTDNEENSQFDRPITHRLYGGDWENRLKQEILLGIGGMLMLKKLGIRKDVYHCNEGHAALINIQRLCDYRDQGLTFDESLELVRASSLYTVHTPVPAGHDYFDEALFGKYMRGYAASLGISWDYLMGLGRNNPDDKGERFCMSVFACKTSQGVNGVSLLHKGVSQQMFAPIWPGYLPEENHVGYVTNGVHFPTWCAPAWKKFYKAHFAPDFRDHQSEEAAWAPILDVPDAEIWALRRQQKAALVDYLRRKCVSDWLHSQVDPSLGISVFEKFNPDALLIGFARRFATYKRAGLLFSDLDRLNRIVNNPDRPVQFIFAGKAHPNDGAGQELIKHIVEISRRPEFVGKILFVENYDMALAQRLVAGVDIWLNTPTRLAEASGTSGEKALMNGVLNLSVLDGWWYEGYRKGAGWALPAERAYPDDAYQNQLDADAIYYLLEKVIAPLYYDRGGRAYAEGWVKCIKNSIAHIAPHYTMKRQLDDYYERFYTPLHRRYALLAADRCAKAKSLAAWKEQVMERWDSIEIKSVSAGKSLDAAVEAGREYEVTVVVDEKGLDDAVGLESVLTRNEKGADRIYAVTPLELVKKEGSLYTFRGKSCVCNTGSFKQAFRMYPKHELLPYREDFCYVRWF